MALNTKNPNGTERVMNTTRSNMIFFITSASVIGFLFHLTWEYLQCSPLFIHLEIVSGTASMIFATFGDVAILWSAYIVVAIFKKSFFWPWTSPNLISWLLLIVVSAVIAEVIEYRAINRQLWTYSLINPKLSGISVIPLFQMALINPLTIIISRKILILRESNIK